MSLLWVLVFLLLKSTKRGDNEKYILRRGFIYDYEKENAYWRVVSAQ